MIHPNLPCRGAALALALLLPLPQAPLLAALSVDQSAERAGALDVHRARADQPLLLARGAGGGGRGGGFGGGGGFRSGGDFGGGRSGFQDSGGAGAFSRGATRPSGGWANSVGDRAPSPGLGQGIDRSSFNGSRSGQLTNGDRNVNANGFSGNRNVNVDGNRNLNVNGNRNWNATVNGNWNRDVNINNVNLSPGWARPGWGYARPWGTGWYGGWASPAWGWWGASAAAWGIAGLATAAVINAAVNDAIYSNTTTIVVPNTSYQLLYGTVQPIGSQGVSFVVQANGVPYSLTADCGVGTLNGVNPSTADQAELLNAACQVAYGAVS